MEGGWGKHKMSWKEVVIDRYDQYTLNEWMEFQLINIILKTAYVFYGKI